MSYKDSLIGDIPGAYAQAFRFEKDIEDTEVSDDEVEQLYEGMVEVSLSRETKSRIRAPWSKTLIVKVNGRTVGLKQYAVDWDFSQPRPLPVKWNPPRPGIFEVNVDAATSDHGGNSSIGIIVRDCTSQTIAANCKLLKACYSAELVEIMALLRGVLLAQELHLPRVILESDALAAIQAINDKSTGSSSGHLIQEIL